MTHHDDLIPPVEPLSDLSWARVERQLWQTLDAPVAVAPPPSARVRWRWPVLAAGAIAAAAAVAVLWPRTDRDGGALGVAPPAPHGSAAPSRVATGASATALAFGDADIELGPHSTLFLSGDEHRGVDLLLESGHARFEVAPRVGRSPFRVHTGAVRVSVIGTGFTVTRDGDSAVVVVSHGRVEVIANGRRTEVRAGQIWDHGTIREKVAVAPAPVVDTAPPPPAVAPPPRRRVIEPATTPSTAAPTPPADQAKLAFRAAVALEASAPAQAQAAYLELARGDGPWAAAALFAAARLSFERGDRSNASALATRYLRRFPQGRNALDARELLERLSAPPP